MNKKQRAVYSYINVRFNPKDLEKVKLLYAASSERSLAAFVRKRLLNKPVKVFYRDRAYDEFLEKAIQLKRNLSAIAVNADAADQALLEQEINVIKALLIQIEEHVRARPNCEKPGESGEIHE